MSLKMLVLIGTAVYALPLLIAIMRGHPDVLAIGVLDLVAGWTVAGWIVALVWSVKSFDPARELWPRTPSTPTVRDRKPSTDPDWPRRNSKGR